MDSISIAAFTPEVKRAVFSMLHLIEADLKDLGGFESFLYLDPGAKQIIRITHIGHRSAPDIQSEIEFIRHLAERGCAVCRAIPFADSSMVKAEGEFVISLFEQAPGRAICDADRTPDMHHRWGRNIAEFHIHAQSLNSPKYKRFEWLDDINVQFRKRIPLDHHKVIEAADKNWQQLSALPKTADVYGLIHSDAHSGNFFIDESGQLAFFDFDDCCYEWYVFDVATILFGVVLNDSVKQTPKARAEAAKYFLADFFTGYSAVLPINDFMLSQMQTFIRTRELSLYGVVHAFMDPDNIQDDFPQKFMVGRRDALENDIPFLDLDFPRLFGS